MWSLILVLWVAVTQAHVFFHYFSPPTPIDRIKELVDVRHEVTEAMIPVLKERHPNMPEEILKSRDPKKVVEFLNENAEELRARSDAESVTYAEAKMAMKLEELNRNADKILTPLLKHYLSFNLGEDKIQLDTVEKLRKAIQKASKVKDQNNVIKNLLEDL